MEWTNACTPRRQGILGDFDDARRHLDDVMFLLRSSQSVEWVSVAADGYRELLESRVADVRRQMALVASLEPLLRTAETARAAANLALTS